MRKRAAWLLSALLLGGCSPSMHDVHESEPEASLTTSSQREDGQASEQGRPDPPLEEHVYAYQVNPDIFPVEPLTDADPAVALLTFDDSPQPPSSHSLDIAETVQRKGANAIFFVMGQFLEDEEPQEMIRTISDMGFEIGNHSYSHPDFLTLSPEEQREEIVRTNKLVEEITGTRPRFLRAPYGQYDAHTLAICEEERMVMMNWTYGYDWEPAYMEGPALERIMVETEFLGKGANLLLHDRSWTAEAIGGIIDGLRAKGYALVDPRIIVSPDRQE